MTDERDREQRILALEEELRALRSSAWRKRPRAAVAMLAIGLVAASLPLATWLHFEDRDASARKAAQLEFRYDRKLQHAAHSQQRHLEYIEAALSPAVGEATRVAALRYLSTQLVVGTKARDWATKELPRVERSLASLRGRWKAEHSRLETLRDERDRAVAGLGTALDPAREKLRIEALDREIESLRRECARLGARIAGPAPG